MKTHSLLFSNLMPALLGLALVPLAMLPCASRATDAFWTNSGFITAPPQIDAVNFVNSGIMSFSTISTIGASQPFETSNTRNFTNSGSMFCSPGWFFYNSAAINGPRRLADNFVNLPGGVVQAEDAGIIVSGGTTPLASYLWVNASNIINKGLLSVPASGWMRLIGDKVNLTRSALEVTSIVPIGSQNNQPASDDFWPDAGIGDVHWGQTNIVSPPGMGTAGLWNGSSAQTWSHRVERIGGFPGTYAFRLNNPFTDAYAATNLSNSLTVTNILVDGTNFNGPTIDLPVDPGDPTALPTNIVEETFDIPTNITRQAAFVTVSDPSSMVVEFGWSPSGNPTNYFQTAHVTITTLSSNVATANPEVNTLYFRDTLASQTNRGVLLNLTSLLNGSTYRPAPYLLSRIPFGFGFPGGIVPDENFLYDPDLFTNSAVASEYAGYGAFINNLPSGPPFIPEGTETNLPGRVQIYADSLDMSRARVRGEGEVIVQAKHLVATSNAVVDCENLSFTLASTNNNLNFVNLAKERVARLRGNMYFWSAVWENQAFFITDNYTIGTTNFDDTGSNIISFTYTNNPVTNSSVVGLYALMIDASSLQATLPVRVWEMNTYSENVEVNDNLSVVRSMYTEAENFTLNGTIRFSSASWDTAFGTTFFSTIDDWTHTNSPNLLNFTNNGTLSVPNRIFFGNDRPTPLNSFVNDGIVTSSSLDVNSVFFQNSGTFSISGPLNIEGVTSSLEDGVSQSTFTRVRSSDLRLNGYTLTAERLSLEVPGALADAGPLSENRVSVTAGFHLVTRPASGDLLGTTFETALPDWVQTDHTWAGEDRGATAAGYENNTAIGSLVISSGERDPLAYFTGAQPNSALYVDLLDIYELGENWEEWIQIDPSLTIYYAAVRANFTPPSLPNGIPQTVEEYLDGKFGGRLQWVQDYAGGRSSVAVSVNGATVFMNSALRNSRVTDSDNDGTPNYFDSTPLGGTTSGTVAGAGITLRSTLVSPGAPQTSKSFSMTWAAAPNTVYQVEVATDLVKGDWQPITLYTNNSALSQTATFSDDNTSSHKQRFYRVRAK